MILFFFVVSVQLKMIWLQIVDELDEWDFDWVGWEELLGLFVQQEEVEEL